MAYTFEVYKDNAGEFRFRFKASNGENMFDSQGYKPKRSVSWSTCRVLPAVFQS